MHINKGDNSSEDARYRYFDGDIAETKQSLSPDVENANEELTSGISEALYLEVEDFLARHEVESDVELDHLIKKLDTASAINGDPRVKALRGELLRKFGKENRP